MGEPPAIKVPVAEYCCVVPRKMLVSGGAMAMEATSAEIRLVDPVIPLKTAVIVAVPVIVPAVARPLLVMPATLAGVAPQVTKEEMFCVMALARVPVALYWMVVLDAIALSSGDTAMDARSELVRTVEPDKPPYDALMVAVPVVDNAALTSPCVSTVAIARLLEVHVALLVTSVFALLEYLPKAFICTVVPGAMLGDSGATSTDVRTGGAGFS